MKSAQQTPATTSPTHIGVTPGSCRGSSRGLSLVELLCSVAIMAILLGGVLPMFIELRASQALQATSLIGHGVLVPGSTTNLANGKAVLGIDLPAAADAVSVTIRDGSGNVVRKLDLGGQAAGTLPLGWDGKTDKGAAAASGQYSFEVSASSAGSALKPTTLSYDQVGSVSTGASGTKLNLNGGRSAALSDVREII